MNVDRNGLEVLDRDESLRLLGNRHARPHRHHQQHAADGAAGQLPLRRGAGPVPDRSRHQARRRHRPRRGGLRGRRDRPPPRPAGAWSSPAWPGRSPTRSSWPPRRPAHPLGERGRRSGRVDPGRPRVGRRIPPSPTPPPPRGADTRTRHVARTAHEARSRHGVRPPERRAPGAGDGAGHTAAGRAVTEDVDEQHLAVDGERGARQLGVVEHVDGELEGLTRRVDADQAVDVLDARASGWCRCRRRWRRPRTAGHHPAA